MKYLQRENELFSFMEATDDYCNFMSNFTLIKAFLAFQCCRSQFLFRRNNYSFVLYMAVFNFLIRLPAWDTPHLEAIEGETYTLPPGCAQYYIAGNVSLFQLAFFFLFVFISILFI